ncbi:MAG: hypothetical protein AAF713_21460 [Pseudomonadota bacterium]
MRASWAVFDGKERLLAHGPDLWRYAHGVDPDMGTVIVPDEASLTRLQV